MTSSPPPPMTVAIVPDEAMQSDAWMPRYGFNHRLWAPPREHLRDLLFTVAIDDNGDMQFGGRRINRTPDDKNAALKLAAERSEKDFCDFFFQILTQVSSDQR